VTTAGRVPGERGKLCKAGLHPRSDGWIPGSGCGSCNQEHALDRAVDAVLAAEPAISKEIGRAAIVQAAPTTRMRTAIAVHLLTHPDALVNGSSAAPAPLRRLIVELRAAGITGMTDPRCLDCGNAKPLIGRVEGGGVCDGCKKRRRIPQQCARCGRVSPREGGDAQGRALCGACHRRSYIRPVHRCTVCGINRAYSTRRRVCAGCAEQPHAACATCGLAARIPVPGTEARCAHCEVSPPTPCAVCGESTICKDRTGRARCEGCYERPVEACGRCGRVRAVVRRAVGSDPDLCAICWTGPTVTCEGCGQVRPCRGERRGRRLCSACCPVADQECAHCHRQKRPMAQWPEGPVCNRCYHRALAAKDRCPKCGETRRLLRYPGFPDPLCSHCAGANPDHVCGRCGAEDDLYDRGLCGRCVLNDRLTALLGDPAQRTHRGLAALFDSFAATESPKDMIRWLAKSPAAPVLGRIARGELACDHETLDRLPASPAVRHLESLLVATGALPARDPALARLEHWIEEFLLANDREPALRTFAHWIVLRRYRRHSHKAPLNASALSHAKTELGSASAFIDWLAARDTSLPGCRQADIDAWLAGSRADRYIARSFARWAIDRGLMPKLKFPTGNRGGPAPPIIDQDLIELARRLLHDPRIAPSDRVAGSLVVLFAQPVIRVARLTVDDITIDTDTVAISLGRTAIVVPEPLAGLLRGLVADRSCRATAQLYEPLWLFSGRVAGRPVDEQVLSRRLKRIGVDCGATRRTALLQLAGQMPAAVLADLLGINILTATKWAETAGRPWGDYPTLRTR
jgi:integrase